MRTVFHLPYDPWFEQVRLDLRVMLLIDDWQKQWCTLALRDFDANAKIMESMLDTLCVSRDWREYEIATKGDVSNCAAQASSFVLDTTRLAFAEQSVFVKVTCDAMQRWHAACLGNLVPVPDAGEIAAPEAFARSRA